MNRFDHLAITVKDIDSSKDFYGKAFGFTTIIDRRFDSAGLSASFIGIPGDSAQIQLNKYDSPHDSVPEFGHFSVRTDDVESLRAQHESQGLAPTPMVNAPHQKCYFVKDPDGYSIEVIQPK